jgi:hypothetical protein
MQEQRGRVEAFTRSDYDKCDDITVAKVQYESYSIPIMMNAPQ